MTQGCYVAINKPIRSNRAWKAVHWEKKEWDGLPNRWGSSWAQKRMRKMRIAGEGVQTFGSLMDLQFFSHWRSCKCFVKDWLSVHKWGICYAFVLGIRHNNFIWDIKDYANTVSKLYKTAHQQNDCLNPKISVIIKLNDVLHTCKRHWVTICRRN